ncbi:MAG: peptidoglycan-binding domain-containing protein [Candidatus Sericytochromatia bacterium]|nr:peptidoglycan-binding domain-containing protein [Candidatus Sericytochromatia bacterium]
MSQPIVSSPRVSRPQVGGRAPEMPPSLAPSPAASWSLDLFTMASATLDDMERLAPGAKLPTTLEPIGGSLQAKRGVLAHGDRGEDVATLQRQLEARGFSVGGVDGTFGPLTEAAVRAFQRSRGLAVDGVVGERTWGALGGPAPSSAGQSGGATPSSSSGSSSRLWRYLNNRYKGARHQCFRYSWTLTGLAGGRPLGSASVLHHGRGSSTSYLSTLEARGLLRPGDVIYVNRSPGADPSSTNLAYGPHWFVYMGNNQYADQYGVRSAAGMAAFVPGRRIDEIHRTMP